MALALTDRGIAQTTPGTSATASCTTSSFTPAAGSVLVALVYEARNSGGTPGALTLSSTHAGAGAWTKQAEYESANGFDANYHPRVAIYTSVQGGSPGAGTVTCTRPAGTVDQWMWMNVVEITGQNSTPVGATGTGVSTSSTLTITLSASPAADSLVIAVVSDDGATTVSIAPPTGYTEIRDTLAGSSWGSEAETAYKNGSASSTVSWTGGPWTPGHTGRAAAIEIKAAAAGATTLTVAPSAQAQTSGAPGLTQHQVLAVAGSAQAQASGSPTLATAGSLTVASSAQAQASGAPALTQHHVLAVASSAQAQASAQALVVTGRFPAAVDATGRYWVDQHGNPWFGVGDSAQSMCAQLSTANITTYLTDRASRGINVVWTNLIEHHFATNAPNNFYNQAPFTGTAFQSSLNNAYWTTVDHVMNEALRLGITVIATPAYLGFNDTEGWAAELVASYGVSAGAGITAYGQALAARYPASQYPNIVWLIGQDRVPNATEKAAYKLIADQLPAAHLIIPSGNSDRWGADGYGKADWASSGITFDADTIYAYDTDPTSMMKTIWANNTGPGGFFEGLYENEQGTDEDRRKSLFGVFCAGGTFALFGNNPIWHFDGPGVYATAIVWTDALSGTGSVQLSYLGDLVEAVGPAWAATVLDSTNTFQTVGAGACRFSTQLGLIYTTTGATVDLTEISGSSALVRWFDPTAGTFTTVGTYSTSGSQVVSDPGANAAGAQDWVLVVESTGAVGLTVAASAQAQASGSPSLTQHQVLAVDSSAQAQASTSPALTATAPSWSLTVDNTAQGQTSTAPSLTQHHALAVQASAQTQQSEVPTLHVAGQLAVQHSAQQQASTTPSLVQHYTLAVASSVQAQASDALALMQRHILAVQASAQAQSSPTVVLGLGGTTLTVTSSAQSQASGTPVLVQHHTLLADASLQAQMSANVRLIGDKILIASVDGPVITGPSAILEVTV